MLLNLRGVSTPDEWENANDAKFNVILYELPVLIIGNPNRTIDSQGEIIEHQPTSMDESGGWPANYEMARSRSEKETLWSEEPGDGSNQEKSQGLGSRMSKGERRTSEARSRPYDLEVGGLLSPVASGSRLAAMTPSSGSSPRTLVHQPRTVDSETTAINTPTTPCNATPQPLSVEVGARVGWFASPKRHSFARPTSSIVFGDL